MSSNLFKDHYLTPKTFLLCPKKEGMIDLFSLLYIFWGTVRLHQVSIMELFPHQKWVHIVYVITYVQSTLDIVEF